MIRTLSRRGVRGLAGGGGRASNCKWANPSVADSAGTDGRRAYCAGECSITPSITRPVKPGRDGTAGMLSRATLRRSPGGGKTRGPRPARLRRWTPTCGSPQATTSGPCGSRLTRPDQPNPSPARRTRPFPGCPRHRPPAAQTVARQLVTERDARFAVPARCAGQAGWRGAAGLSVAWLCRLPRWECTVTGLGWVAGWWPPGCGLAMRRAVQARAASAGPQGIDGQGAG
jgi:hypothetical protein